MTQDTFFEVSPTVSDLRVPFLRVRAGRFVIASIDEDMPMGNKASERDALEETLPVDEDAVAFSSSKVGDRVPPARSGAGP